MIPSLSPYPAMKDSGVPWLGQVPEHWEVYKLKHLTRFYNGIAFKPGDWSDSGIPIIRIQNLNGSDQFNYTKRSDLPSFLRVHPGDLLFSWSGNRGTSFGPFIWSRSFDGYLNQHIFKLDGYSLNRIYFARLLRAVTRHIEEQSHGIIGLVHVTKPELGAVMVPVASLPEQAAIVRFLDHYDRKIRRYIRAKQKLIKLLEEQKQAIIHRAVTRGLDPHVRLKPSGVEWLGDIPEHWGVERTKNLFRLRTQKSGSAHGLELLSIYTHIGVRPRKDLEERGNKASTTDDYWIVRKGDIISNKLLAWMGAVGVSEYEGVTSPAYDILMPIRRLCSVFYHHLFRTNLYLQMFKQRSRGIMEMRLRLYFDQLGQIPLLVPPVEEQFAIVASCVDETADLEKTIDVTRREISLLREFRTRLIADVVTGKLDVREAAAQLPEEIEEPETLEDNGEALPEDEENGEEGDAEIVEGEE